jgi:hypothetical protein
MASGASGLLPLGGVAIALLAAALGFGWPAGIPWALSVLGGEFVGALYVRGGSLDVAAAVYGAALLLTAELAYWSLDARTRSDDQAGLALRRGAVVLMVGIGSLGIGLVGVAVARLRVEGSLALTAVAVGAAVLALVIVAAMARRTGSGDGQADRRL